MPRTVKSFRSLAFLLLVLLVSGRALAQAPEDMKVLVVSAHPDDETMYAATLYRLTHAFGAKVDLAVITDGSAGYDYAMLAEPIYHLPLADEPHARQYLPAVRKREVMEGGKILGLRKYFFMDELDNMYTTNVDTILQHVWDVAAVRHRLHRIMSDGDYDYVFVLLPEPSQHGHHKAASILALETATKLDPALRPVVLGGMMFPKDSTLTFTGLPGYPITNVNGGEPAFSFDRHQPLESDHLLDHQVIVNWVIAAHKSQGTLQLLINKGDVERFWYFDVNDPSRFAATKALFDRLNTSSY
ncbi:MAG TPA: PIG-L family deacetylase [Rhodothermales bacterium]|nr:PIG-L family deacetylase [Rhodothermales bacterium]